MPIELWSKLIAEAPSLVILVLVVLKILEKLDKLSERFGELNTTVKALSARIEMVGKIQDARLDLHEERIADIGGHPTTAPVAGGAPRGANGAGPITRRTRPSWPDTASTKENDE